MMNSPSSSAEVQTWSDITETPTLNKTQIVFTAGSTVMIDAPAEKVFKVITDVKRYSEWNTWCPKFELQEGEESLKVGTIGKMHVYMKEQDRTFTIPEEILELQNNAEEYKLSWRGGLLPSWAGKAERVQTVKPISKEQCQFKQWESMSGISSYIFKYLMGIPNQLANSNIIYSNDVKKRAEGLYKN